MTVVVSYHYQLMRRFLASIVLFCLSMDFVRAAESRSVLVERRAVDNDSQESSNVILRRTCTRDICDCTVCQARQWAFDSIDDASSSCYRSEVELAKTEKLFDERQARAESVVALLLDASGDMFTTMMNWAFEDCSRDDIIAAFCDIAIFNNLPVKTVFKSENLSLLIGWLRSATISDYDIVRLLYKQWLLADGETIRCLIALFPPAEAVIILRREFKLDDHSSSKSKTISRIMHERRRLASALDHARKITKSKAKMILDETSKRRPVIGLAVESTSKPAASVLTVDVLKKQPEKLTGGDCLIGDLFLSPHNLDFRFV